MIAGIDDVSGKIRNDLETKGIAYNTIFVLMDDNGFFLEKDKFLVNS